MFKKKLVSLSLISLMLPVMLSALPQDLEVFTDFENISGEGEFFIGEDPNRVKIVGFTVETLEDPALLHSGTKVITLGPGQEGVIVSERGLDEIQFYAAENTGAGKIEYRGNSILADGTIGIVLALNGVIDGLPNNISPGANPPLQGGIADSGVFFDNDDFDFIDGIREIKIKDVTGKLSIDDLGFTLTSRPSNNTVYTYFDEFSVGVGQFEPIVIGTSPYTASFDGGIIMSGASENPTHSGELSYGIPVNGDSFEVVFETPAYEIDTYAGALLLSSASESDGSIEVYDTDDNLIATFTDFTASGGLRFEFKPPF